MHGINKFDAYQPVGQWLPAPLRCRRPAPEPVAGRDGAGHDAAGAVLPHQDDGGAAVREVVPPPPPGPRAYPRERKKSVWGQSASVRVDMRGGRNFNKTKY